MPQQPAVDGVGIFARLHDELVEARRAAEQNLAVLRELARRISRLRQILLGQFLQPDFAVDRHEDVDHQRDQRLIGADIRSRLLAADVLLARRQRQHESAPALLVDGLADQPPGHLPHIFFARGDHAAVGTAESQRHAERLRLHGDHVGLARRLDDSQRNRFGDRNHQHRAMLVRDLGNRRDIFNRAEEIRRLNQHARGLRSDRLLQFFQIHAAIVVETGNRQRHALVRRISRQHFAILRMQAARHHHRPPAGQADRHHHALGRGRRTVIHGRVRHFHARSVRRSWSEIRRWIAACPAKSPPDKACRRSETRRAKSANR